MRIAIVGCGLNSDYHLNFAKEYPGAEIVGIVDRDQEKARACADKHGIRAVFPGIQELVDAENPDVIHIVTPPRTHAALAREALARRCHVLIEKPLALDLQEATELYDLAERQGVRLCAMHNHFFDPCMARAHQLVREGMAGEIMNVESYYGLNTRIPAFREYPAPNVLPWLYTLPGGVYHDFMAHPLYVMLEYTGRPKELKVMKRSHGVLPRDLPDELKVVIDGERAFGTLTFSFAARPHLHFLRIYGSSMMVEVDFNTMTTVAHPQSRLPKAAQKATYNLSESSQRFSQTVSNVSNFLRGKLKPYHGMKLLIHRFYDAVQGGGEMPVTRDQALLVIETMDRIWEQLRPEPLTFDPVIPPSSTRAEKQRVLVTGGTGFLGKNVVRGLTQAGYQVRVLARKLSPIEGLRNGNVEIYFGDVADKASLAAAFEGVDLVVHAAAGTSGKKQDCEQGTLQGTRNVLELCEGRKVRKLVYISSCSVYGVTDCKTDQRVTEGSALERFPNRRGDYSASKQAAEDLVRWSLERSRFPAVILRPGTIYGPGGEVFSPMLGLSLFDKLFVVFGLGGFILPYVYIDNVVDAIIKSLQSREADNRIFNVADEHGITKRQYMQAVVKRIHPRALVLYCPLGLLYAATAAQEFLARLLNRAPFLTRYRLISSQRSVRYDSSKIRETLHWAPRISFAEAAARMTSSTVSVSEDPGQPGRESADHADAVRVTS